MANAQIGNINNWPAASAGAGVGNRSNLNGGTTALIGTLATNTGDIQSMRNRLAIIDAGFYTAARLDVMTKNDMEYAIRVNDFANTIKQ